MPLESETLNKTGSCDKIIVDIDSTPPGVIQPNETCDSSIIDVYRNKEADIQKEYKNGH